MVTPSAEHHEYEYDRLLCRLLEEGRSWSPPAAAAATPSQSPSLPSPLPSTSPHGGAPSTTSEPRRRTPAWAGAIRGFSNALCLVILVLLVAPMAMQSTSKEDVFGCVFMFILSFAFPVFGYVVTWDQP